jgi:hypothetical protein
MEFTAAETHLKLSEQLFLNLHKALAEGSEGEDEKRSHKMEDAYIQTGFFLAQVGPRCDSV